MQRVLWIVASGAVGEGGCGKGEFSCRTPRKCMNVSLRCDGNMDCSDGSDETPCQKCGKDAFFCYVHRSCISPLLKCNGASDCGEVNGSDESSCDTCTNDAFLCKQDRKCIPTFLRCDGYEDCSDGSDETSCDACSDDVFFCQWSRECIVQASKCDGHQDCTDGSDESSCAECPIGRFKCLNSTKCISSAWECDGYEDCSDGSDEILCDCIRPSLTMGVKVPEETNLTFDSFQVTAECEDTYTGALTVEKCEKGRAAYKIDGTCTEKMPTSALPPTTMSASLRKNVTVHTVLTLKGTLPRHGEVCQNSHLLIQTIKASLTNLMNATNVNWMHIPMAWDIVVVGVYSSGQKQRCTDSGGIRLRRSLRGVENQILLIEYVLFVSSLAEQNLDTIVSTFSGDDVDVTLEFADVSDDYIVVSAITTTTDLEDKERYFLDTASVNTTSVTPEPHEWNSWAYVICVVLFLLIVGVACSAYRRCAERNTSEPSTLKIHDASVYMRDIVRGAPDMHKHRGDESHASEFLVRRTPSMPVNREALENTSDSGSIYSIVSDSVPEAISDSSSIYPIVLDSIPAPVSDSSVYSICLPDFSSGTQDRQL